MIGAFLQKFGQRIATLGYVMANPDYAEVRRNGGARDLYRLLNRSWLPRQSVGTVLDVGANEGQFIKVARRLFPDAGIIAFEPNPELIGSLQSLLSNSSANRVLQVACGRESASMALNVTTFSPASSLLSPTALRIPEFPVIEADTTITVKVERIDRLVGQSSSARKPYLLKIDVQGFELEVLHGATGILPNVFAVICEVNAASFYEGQADFEEIYAFMHEHNFKLADIGEPIRAMETAEVLYFDAAFLNTSLRPDPLGSRSPLPSA